MAIKRIQQISCSLNLGLIYNLDYNYDPKSGSSIKIYFVNESGQYNKPKLLPLQKAFIQIGSASFTMYAVASGQEYSFGRRVIWVEFVDEFFKLSHYYIALPGRGCGQNVFTLGTPVDNRALSLKQDSSVDPTATQIKEFTQFPDYVYSFSEFLAILRQKFNCTVTASYDSTIKRDFEGSFLNVLQSWCGYYNLSFFFENGIIKIFDPSRLVITLPTQPSDALSYDVEEDARSTYGKTVCNWFQQEGGEYSLGQVNSSKGPLYVRSSTLYPATNIYGLKQPYLDPNQVIAAQYGEDFWFVYNYWLGTASQNCGWTERADLTNGTFNISQSVQSIGNTIAILNSSVFQENFTTYSEYGASLAGRWYLSNEISDLAAEQPFTWFGEQDGQQISNFDEASSKQLKIDYLFYTSGEPIIPQTAINNNFPGFKYGGNRMAYYDNYELPTGSFFLGTLQQEVNYAAELLRGSAASNAVDFSELYETVTGSNSIVSCQIPVLSQELKQFFNTIPQKTSLLAPRYSLIPIKGISTTDYLSSKLAAQEDDSIQIVNGLDGPNLLSNTAVIKTLQQGSYTVYYDKYSTCSSVNTTDEYFNYEFQPQQISSDNQIGVTFEKNASNTYSLKRDYSVINSLVNPPGFQSLAQARAFTTQRVSYSLNYFENVPREFLTNGLVSMNVSISENGVKTSYTYSNEVLQVPDTTSEIVKIQQSIRNSWIRQYNPTSVIT